MSGIRVLADDLTGALDTAAAFAGEVPVFIDRPSALADSKEAAVAVVATPTRDVPPEDLPRYLEPSLAWLKAGEVAFKKVDSLLRGNTFAEIAWLARQGGFDLTVFAPAFPAQGRITTERQQWVVEPGKLAGPRRPVAKPLDEAFAQFGLRTESVAVPKGGGIDVWAPDVLSDADLDKVMAASDQKDGCFRLLCGSAGLAHALARRRGIAAQAGLARPLAAGAGPTILVSASHHPVLRAQWTLLRSEATTQVIAEHARDIEITAALGAVRNGIGEAWFDLSPEERITPAEADQLLAAQTMRLVAGLPKPGQLIVVGGDTLLGLCRAAGVEALLAQPSIRNGWGCARLQGGAWDGVPCYSRSGAFGGPDDLVTLKRLLNHSPVGWKGN